MTDITERLRQSQHSHLSQSCAVEAADEIDTLRQRVKAFESLETKRMKDAVTVDDWRRIAEHMEYQWRCCSEGFNARCGELRQRVKALESEVVANERIARDLENKLAALNVDNGLTIAYMSGFRDGKKDALKHGEPVLYACTKCGGANYACDCDSFRYCTKPLYEGRGDA